jgi:hypothetical protein
MQDTEAGDELPEKRATSYAPTGCDSLAWRTRGGLASIRRYRCDEALSLIVRRWIHLPQEVFDRKWPRMDYYRVLLASRRG